MQDLEICVISDGQYLNTFVFKYISKYICVFRTVFRNSLPFMYLNTVFKYFNEYLNTMYLNTQKSI